MKMKSNGDGAVSSKHWSGAWWSPYGHTSPFCYLAYCPTQDTKNYHGMPPISFIFRIFAPFSPFSKYFHLFIYVRILLLLFYFY